MGNMQIYLKAKDKLFINGAVIRVDRKVSVELLNDATFLLQNHVLQPEEADTAMRQLYFSVQLMLMDPANKEAALAVFKDMVRRMLASLSDRKLLEAIKEADVLVHDGKAFAALKAIRDTFAHEREVLGSAEDDAADHRQEEETALYAGARHG